jgi:hypothetical protein
VNTVMNFVSVEGGEFVDRLIKDSAQWSWCFGSRLPAEVVL